MRQPRPRRILMMVRGAAARRSDRGAAPLLEPGDILMDGGNSHYPDTTWRCCSAERGLLYVGAGVSGGEEGRWRFPSIMPGGHADAWPHIQPIFQASRRVDDGTPCCDWIGPDGSGHFVKMVHNGIEYGDMQLIAEAYHLMATGLGMAPSRRWCGGVPQMEQGPAGFLSDRNHGRHSRQDRRRDRAADGGCDSRCGGAEGDGQMDVAGRARSRRRHSRIAKAVFGLLPVGDQGRARWRPAAC